MKERSVLRSSKFRSSFLYQFLCDRTRIDTGFFGVTELFCPFFLRSLTGLDTDFGSATIGLDDKLRD